MGPPDPAWRPAGETTARRTTRGQEMELYQLQCFMAVVEEGGFNRATTRVHITQPALSYQIKQLEDELGVSLFHRRPRGIMPMKFSRP